MYRIAFAGVRHAHAIGLLGLIDKTPDLELVALCEEDPEHSLLSTIPERTLTHTNYQQMLAEVPCDIVAIGDYYGRRGSMAIAALKAGKHVISDKPLCTSLDELEQIRALSTEKGLSVAVMVEHHNSPEVNAARNIIQSGILGEVIQIQFSAQHPLQPGVRPGWYFEPGKHGGPINDIAPHGLEGIHWMTGLKFDKVLFSRSWRALDRVPGDCFLDAGQFAYTLENGCGVMGDVSYHGLDAPAFKLNTYWRFNIWGTKGMMELGHVNTPECLLYTHDKPEPEYVPMPDKLPGHYLDNMLAEIEGRPCNLTTADHLETARQALLLQNPQQ